MMSRRLFLRHCYRFCTGAIVAGSLGLGFGASNAFAASPDQQRDFFRAVQMDDAGTVRTYSR